MKKNGIIIILLTLIFITSCSDNEIDNNSPNGKWIENTPENSRTELLFSATNNILKRDTKGNSEDEYIYKIENGKIYLTSYLCSTVITTEHYFNQINDKTLEVGNLYPSVGLTQTKMTFTKE